MGRDFGRQWIRRECAQHLTHPLRHWQVCQGLEPESPPSGVPSSLEGPKPSPPPPPRVFSSCWGLQPKHLPPRGPFLAFPAVVVLFHFVVVISFSLLLKYLFSTFFFFLTVLLPFSLLSTHPTFRHGICGGVSVPWPGAGPELPWWEHHVQTTRPTGNLGSQGM